MKSCSKCKISKPLSEFWRQKRAGDGLQCHCKQCQRPAFSKIEPEKQRQYFKKWRRSEKGKKISLKLHKKWKAENPIKFKAQQALRLAVKKGFLKKPIKCKKCKKVSKLQGHHEDYNFPLVVIWLCPSCHWAVHHKN